jgi:hypothetical protein
LSFVLKSSWIKAGVTLFRMSLSVVSIAVCINTIIQYNRCGITEIRNEFEQRQAPGNK